MTTLEHEPIRTADRQRRAALSGPRPFVVGAICRRDLARYFTNVAGYVFIVLFIATSAVAAFWPEAFFADNLASLGQLNELMPYLLLLFIPAITMSIWADERRQGTEELLLTLPARDLEVVLGKYLAALGIYTAALGFLAVGLLSVLAILGEPDLGVFLATLLGYWLMGGMLLAVGMVASLLSGNVTVAFILGALFCAVPVFAELLGGLSDLEGARVIEGASAPSQFREFGRGVVPFSGVVYFVGLAAAMLYVNVALVGRRHWAGGERGLGLWGHALVRIAAVVVAVLSLQTLVARAGGPAGPQRRAAQHALGRIEAARPGDPRRSPRLHRGLPQPRGPRRLRRGQAEPRRPAQGVRRPGGRPGPIEPRRRRALQRGSPTRRAAVRHRPPSGLHRQRGQSGVRRAYHGGRLHQRPGAGRHPLLRSRPCRSSTN